MKGMHFSLDPIPEILTRRGFEPYGKVQKYIDSEVLRLSSPYIPHLSGTLEKSGNLHTDVGSGEVIWNTPYARYQYYERVMVGSPPKQVTNIPLKYHGGGLRGGFWFERMKVDHKSEIIAGAAKIAGGTAK
nr:MAG TPA: Minor capsid protein [Caudoviricetes sp.]